MRLSLKITGDAKLIKMVRFTVGKRDRISSVRAVIIPVLPIMWQKRYGKLKIIMTWMEFSVIVFRTLSVIVPNVWRK